MSVGTKIAQAGRHSPNAHPGFLGLHISHPPPTLLQPFLVTSRTTTLILCNTNLADFSIDQITVRQRVDQWTKCFLCAGAIFRQ